MALMVSASLGSALIRFVAYVNQPLTGYGWPVSVASRMPVVIVSRAKGYLPAGIVDLALGGRRVRRDTGSPGRPCDTGV